MRAARARAAERARGGATAREIDIPLPLRGLFVEAKNAEVSALFAGELHNWRSTGVDLETREPFKIDNVAPVALQRIPYEFRGASGYIELKSTAAVFGPATIQRAFDGNALFAYISQNVLIADGVDEPVRFDGLTMTPCDFLTTTGKPITEFDGVAVHHDRPYLWDTNGDLEFYYGDVGAVQGALVRFPLSRLGNITGTMFAALPMAITGANSSSDALCIFTSTGDIVIYEGLDPGDPADWRIAGRVRVARPLSRFGFAQVGADLWMLTMSGLVSVRQSIANGAQALVSDMSRPIHDELLRMIREGGEWQLHTSADGTKLIINRVLDGSASQFIYHFDAPGWSTADYPARRWMNLAGKTQFQEITGHLATLGEEGSPITARWTTSWFRLPRAGGINYILPTIIARGPLDVTVTLLSDHEGTAEDVAEAVQTVTLMPDRYLVGGTPLLEFDMTVGTNGIPGSQTSQAWRGYDGIPGNNPFVLGAQSYGSVSGDGGLVREFKANYSSGVRSVLNLLGNAKLDDRDTIAVRVNGEFDFIMEWSPEFLTYGVISQDFAIYLNARIGQVVSVAVYPVAEFASLLPGLNTFIIPDPTRQLALNDLIAVDGVGSAYRLTLEVTSLWAKIVNIKAAIA